MSTRTDGEAIRANARAARLRLVNGGYSIGSDAIAAGAVVADIRPLSDFEVESVDWLWHHRIPFGKITILEGMPDVGKSHLTLELAALVTVGGTLPDGSKIDPGNVVLVTCEDGLADTVRPRFDEAGGDPTALHVLSGFRLNGSNDVQIPVIPDHVPAIRAEVERVGARLLIIDPLTAYLGEKINAHRDHDVRRALAPLQRMAEETGCAVLVVRHLRKGAAGDAISAGGGSIGFTGLARCVLLAAKDPDDESRRVLAWTKNNLAEKQPSLSYRLESLGGEWAHVVWEGVSKYNANELLEAARPDEERGKTDSALDWLREYLRDGAVGAAEAKRAGREQGFSDRTVERARERLGAVVKRDGFGKGSKVLWQLPLEQKKVGEYGGERAPNPLNDKGSTYSPSVASMGGEKAILANGGEYISDEAGIAFYARTNGH